MITRMEILYSKKSAIIEFDDQPEIVLNEKYLYANCPACQSEAETYVNESVNVVAELDKKKKALKKAFNNHWNPNIPEIEPTEEDYITNGLTLAFETARQVAEKKGLVAKAKIEEIFTGNVEQNILDWIGGA